MTESLIDWPRPYFKQSGGKPFLFYVVCGELPDLPGLPWEQYRSAGVPEGFSLFQYPRGQYPEVLTGFQEGYGWDEFRARNPLMADRVADSEECLVLRGEIGDTDTLNYLRDSVGLVTYLLDHGGIAVHDPFLFYWWESDEWRQQIFSPGQQAILRHVVILTSEEPETNATWFHTRGMRKFGRPDLSLHNVAAQYNEAVTDLFSRFIELQAHGGIVEEGKEIRMKSLPDGMTCHHRGDLDDPDFNNVHVEIEWP